MERKYYITELQLINKDGTLSEVIACEFSGYSEEHVKQKIKDIFLFDVKILKCHPKLQ